MRIKFIIVIFIIIGLLNIPKPSYIKSIVYHKLRPLHNYIEKKYNVDLNWHEIHKEVATADDNHTKRIRND